MTNPRGLDDGPLNPPDVDPSEMRRELAGEEALDDQDGIVGTDQIDTNVAGISDTEMYQGESGLMQSHGASVANAESLELLEDLDLRSDETNDPNVAAEEGLPWVPPVDPPVVPSSDPQGAVVAAGFASSALDVPFDADNHDSLLSAEDEMTDRVREALRADSSTTEYADTIDIETEGGVVVLRGVVEDLDDDDNLVAVASTVTGVEEVVNELEIASL